MVLFKNKEENLDFIESQALPKFNLFPFYKITNDTDILIITNKEDSSIPFSELKGSSFLIRTESFSVRIKRIFMFIHSIENYLPILIV